MRVRQALVLAVGAALITLGLLLVVLPGPFTIPLLVAGTVVLASEFAWAHTLLARLKAALDAAGQAWQRQPTAVKAAAIAAAAATAATFAAMALQPDLLPAWVPTLPWHR